MIHLCFVHMIRRMGVVLIFCFLYFDMVFYIYSLCSWIYFSFTIFIWLFVGCYNVCMCVFLFRYDRINYIIAMLREAGNVTISHEYLKSVE